ncbi:MAG: HEAT repeat domain-containing protein [Candidatus Omnitrophica bacterium]|nr:HEAT repeat domain-containing protein [Candidatus Omnitrophota bacterium]
MDAYASAAELTAVLEDRNPHIRSAAARMLGDMGPAAAEAVPYLVRLLRDKDLRVQVSAAIALFKIEPVVRDVLPYLKRALEREAARAGYGQVQDMLRTSDLFEEASDLQQQVIEQWTLFQRGDTTSEVVPLLLQALNEKDADLRALAVLLLAGVDNKSGEVISGLRRALNDSSQDVRACAVLALEREGPSAQGAASDFARLLNSREERLRAAIALARIDPEGRQALDTLIVIFRDESEEETNRVQAVNALGQLQPPGGYGLDEIVETLSDPNNTVRAACTFVLVRMKDESVPHLLKALKHRKREMRSAAAQALGATDSAREEVVLALVESMKDREWDVRYSAAQSLGQVGASSPEAVQALVEALRDPATAVRSCASEALVKIGETAVSPLSQAAASDDSSLSARAAMLLEKIQGEVARR